MERIVARQYRYFLNPKSKNTTIFPGLYRSSFKITLRSNILDKLLFLEYDIGETTCLAKPPFKTKYYYRHSIYVRPNAGSFPVRHNVIGIDF